MEGSVMKTSIQSTNKPRAPVLSSMDVCDLGGGSGTPRLHTGGAKNLWVEKNHHTRGERLKIATYTIVMGDFNAIVGGQTNTSERVTGCFGLGQRNERGDTLVEWATSKNFKITNTQFQKNAGTRWTWRSPDGQTKNEIYYIMSDKPIMVTVVTDINRINIGSDHRMVMGSITLNTRAERRKLLHEQALTIK